MNKNKKIYFDYKKYICFSKNNIESQWNLDIIRKLLTNKNENNGYN